MESRARELYRKVSLGGDHFERGLAAADAATSFKKQKKPSKFELLKAAERKEAERKELVKSTDGQVRIFACKQFRYSTCALEAQQAHVGTERQGLARVSSF